MLVVLFPWLSLLFVLLALLIFLKDKINDPKNKPNCRSEESNLLCHIFGVIVYIFDEKLAYIKVNFNPHTE
jgi:hypothetical protein